MTTRDEAGIAAAVLDYFEGWFDGDEWRIVNTLWQWTQ
jgi:hypothetical protein